MGLAEDLLRVAGAAAQTHNSKAPLGSGSRPRPCACRVGDGGLVGDVRRACEAWQGLVATTLMNAGLCE